MRQNVSAFGMVLTHLGVGIASSCFNLDNSILSRDKTLVHSPPAASGGFPSCHIVARSAAKSRGSASKSASLTSGPAVAGCRTFSASASSTAATPSASASARPASRQARSKRRSNARRRQGLRPRNGHRHDPSRRRRRGAASARISRGLPFPHAASGPTRRVRRHRGRWLLGRRQSPLRGRRPIAAPRVSNRRQTLRRITGYHHR